MIFEDSNDESKVINNIIWGNFEGQISNTNSNTNSNTEIIYNNIQGGKESIIFGDGVYNGNYENNIDVNPMLLGNLTTFETG